jgi:hypothetical protein
MDTAMGQSFQDFFASLPPALTRRGEKRASDAVLGKRVRAELALAVERGVFPTGTAFSVRFSGHGTLVVGIVTWSGSVFTDAYTEYIMDPTMPDPTLNYGMPGLPRLEANSRLAPPLATALRHAREIANRHNYDNSDSRSDHFDSGYSLDVQADVVEALCHRGMRTEADPKFAALQDKALAVAATLGPKVVRSVCGRAGIRGASEWSLNRLMKIAERADGRPMAYDKRRGGWYPSTGGAQ